MKFKKKTLILNNKPKPARVDIFEFGSGAPRVAILNGLHGLERSGGYLGLAYARQFKRQGLLSVIPFANPTSRDQNTRLTPEDRVDLNRVFPGANSGTLSIRLARKLFDYLKTFDLVIDIHNFPKMDMPFVGAWITQGPEKLQQRTLRLIQSFRPEYIWKLDTRRDEKNKAGSLVEALLNSGVAAFSLEAPDIELIKPRHVTGFINGVERIFRSLNNSRDTKSQNPKLITRIPALAPISGFFVPQVRIGQMISKNQPVGNLINMENLKTETIRSPIGGPAVFVLKKTLVKVGDRVAIIGNVLKEE
ncbi:MAG: hypothetical protein A3J07_03880 [Candidatus Doudnabacteria bacterium RIFCSPLOWO2_02_FULL_49_13]|uniref:Succinylglutamate desuccinylase/Aspartoacylase catalytic domain-containing protein n=1 Tax=Candidatus Doudnabacteria bacterium RIFCSPHIGHO2_12_FULL_48_16 TaxID=1817838 RepID=A0A1F5PJE9_9BACT|nr:MAG: hypothetical protein A3B77_02690 [Candidatus Doudnabacteria bacterium RIFCSPHIGHO2_02_FULL_49_24]OGE89613.1 MAG: hypothetical protein A2760_03895 [Candidatus Doudnabacteria bacterium RIFCSPHIGHO2_01_FULL_50_67]OGE90056.1 MAG: hypothetical protein A3E29_03025 [Candidatus Doudnabacteria bacterium RIFCSPHIGHO2_12_FULL_48_16]OGE96629.1 MAG: hypothetical protein A2990_00335 [Candidatus Doudnabacteria bacterium RIFCSPLOWO2_01_FULL_49_40]OGF02851.1 MAG: hypothetical protein A3H14_00820 [Candid